LFGAYGVATGEHFSSHSDCFLHMEVITGEDL